MEVVNIYEEFVYGTINCRKVVGVPMAFQSDDIDIEQLDMKRTKVKRMGLSTKNIIQPADGVLPDTVNELCVKNVRAKATNRDTYYEVRGDGGKIFYPEFDPWDTSSRILLTSEENTGIKTIHDFWYKKYPDGSYWSHMTYDANILMDLPDYWFRNDNSHEQMVCTITMGGTVERPGFAVNDNAFFCEFDLELFCTVHGRKRKEE